MGTSSQHTNMEVRNGYDSTIRNKERLDRGEKLTIVDVREDEEVAAGMIQGAIHIPLGSIARPPQ